VALARADCIEVDDLPSAVRGKYAEVLLPSIARGESLRAFGSRYARLVLARCSQNKRRACQVLGISYHTLRAYIEYEPWGRPTRGVPAEWPGAAACGGRPLQETGPAESPAEDVESRVTPGGP
jgi:hypothetical protein